ncbi:MAG: pentapeptide repeat-containing protein [Leptolyngbyaceae cyanobacterium bins.302]|nr:pentapeptide repeat-containing protein [Leptolyngbyaceae cyanobacterium bins.302]
MVKEIPVANEEQLKLLMQGVKVWNEWRKNNPEVGIDLSEADLKEADLKEFNLHRANLSRAFLSEADLQGTVEYGQICVNSVDSFNETVYEIESYLFTTDLSEADLSEAFLIGANLSFANLGKAHLSKAYLSETDFSWANLKNANLNEADLSSANLSSANLSEAHLSSVNLNEADLSSANLRSANLSGTNLSKAQVLGTNFTGANLTGACIEDWHSNSATKLDEVECDYIYLKSGNQERRPSDPKRNFEPGEFTKLFQKFLSTVDLIFRNGVDWQALLISLEKLRVEAAGAELSIQAIENKNDGAFVVRVNTPPEADKAEVEKFLKREYEVALKAIEARYEMQLQLQGEQLQFYREEMAAKRQDNTQLMEVLKTMAEKENQAPKYDMRNSNFANFADTIQDGGKQQTVQHIYAPEQNLAAAAAEIQQLLAVVNPKSDDEFAEAVYREIQKNPTLKARLVNALKSGGLEALKAIFNHPAFSIPAETIKGWLEAE